ncbi:MAG: TldD/PmbA family protein, partial [Candidatus Eisenbacteria bacterium]|nr:TldD/PmbA family protein [Candidatus Eisenbacteria bacterium]
MQESLEKRFRNIAPPVQFCSLRFVEERDQVLQVRQNVLQPVHNTSDVGVMITVVHDGGIGYAATSDLSESGLARAAGEARDWAQKTAGSGVVDFSSVPMPRSSGQYRSPVQISWDSMSLEDKIELLRRESARLKTDERIVDWEASLWYTETDSVYLTADGGRVEQRLRQIVPSLAATANEGAETQTRSLGGRGFCRQGGLEVLSQVGFHDAAPRLAEEALQLLSAPNCPTGKMDLLLDPDQMILQIHESIGHPLELDRILGD